MLRSSLPFKSKKDKQQKEEEKQDVDNVVSPPFQSNEDGRERSFSSEEPRIERNEDQDLSITPEKMYEGVKTRRKRSSSTHKYIEGIRNNINSNYNDFKSVFRKNGVSSPDIRSDFNRAKEQEIEISKPIRISKEADDALVGMRKPSLSNPLANAQVLYLSTDSNSLGNSGEMRSRSVPSSPTSQSFTFPPIVVSQSESTSPSSSPKSDDPHIKTPLSPTKLNGVNFSTFTQNPNPSSSSSEDLPIDIRAPIRGLRFSDPSLSPKLTTGDPKRNVSLEVDTALSNPPSMMQPVRSDESTSSSKGEVNVSERLDKIEERLDQLTKMFYSSNELLMKMSSAFPSEPNGKRRNFLTYCQSIENQHLLLLQNLELTSKKLEETNWMIKMDAEKLSRIENRVLAVQKVQANSFSLSQAIVKGILMVVVFLLNVFVICKNFTRKCWFAVVGQSVDASLTSNQNPNPSIHPNNKNKTNNDTCQSINTSMYMNSMQERLREVMRQDEMMTQKTKSVECNIAGVNVNNSINNNNWRHEDQSGSEEEESTREQSPEGRHSHDD